MSVRRVRVRPVAYLVTLAFGLGLSASAFVQPGGLVRAPAAEPATRLVYSGPMPGREEPVAAVSLRPNRPAVPEIWVPPATRPQPVSLPSIPEYELISDAKVATIKGRPLLADEPFDQVVPEELQPVRPFMTRLPTPALAAPVPDVPAVFCEGFC